MSSRIEVEKLGVILAPTKNNFENEAVLNPGCYQDGDFIHLFYRAVDENLKSSIGYAKLEGPDEVIERWDEPIMEPTRKNEKDGVEDPRIVKIGDTFYMTYVAHDGKNALVAYATSKDLKKFSKKGIISPQLEYNKAAEIFREGRLKDRYFMFEAYYEEFTAEDVLVWDKDAFFFPKKIKGKYVLVHRILPDIQLVYFNDFKELKRKTFWKNYLGDLYRHVILENKYWFESRNIGGGAPPIETDEGWLLIYHAVEELNLARIYHAGAALLDKNNPLKVIGRLDYPLFSPEEEWEKRGAVSNVVFPTGTAIFGNDLYIYYGAADSQIALAKTNLNDLLEEIKSQGDPKRS